MVLFTKEILVQLKEIIQISVNLNINEYPDSSNNINKTEQWRIYIHGISKQNPPQGEMFTTYIALSSKEEAYRVFKELAQQVVDSGEISELQSQLFDEVFTKEEK